MVLNLAKHRLAFFMVLFSCLFLPFIFKSESIKEKIKPELVEQKAIQGEYLSWEEVNKLFPKYARATLVDLDTQMKFHIQRRGGSYHADVQPLTADDTSIMKKIYGGEWSWKRRAAILQLDNGRMIAASMNGMPHGSGAIPNNNFPGHFCVHFRDSTTHGSRKSDWGHRIMIWKTAGILDRELKLLEPEDIIRVFVVAMDQGDNKIAGKVMSGSKEDELSLAVAEIKYIRLDKIEKKEDNLYRVGIRLALKGSSREYLKNVEVKILQKDGAWLIDYGFLRRSLRSPQNLKAFS
ncbi:hypothetical protein [Syntrophomonas wolfei]|uniref:Uncharacterized protein n=1 Tax=Syntrophomonas wolfei subsp. wolfei (strain DSM 2245B / Goettingen) TaxID=335541 RepID=Q0AU78_SYNWW|nr:hypothetical protein [Syntrophomonas wolfei]ABI69726.1 hypothetical protein Swol_2437 [Syntrophomonas wolfei subsp. wolfei str. Goettingen G311]